MTTIKEWKTRKEELYDNIEQMISEDRTDIDTLKLMLSLLDNSKIKRRDNYEKERLELFRRKNTN